LANVVFPDKGDPAIMIRVGAITEPVKPIFIHKSLAVGRLTAFSSSSLESRRYVELFESLEVALDPVKVSANTRHKEYDSELHHPPDLSSQKRIDSPSMRASKTSSKTDRVVLTVEKIIWGISAGLLIRRKGPQLIACVSLGSMTYAISWKLGLELLSIGLKAA
jgi:hypothetical protein